MSILTFYSPLNPTKVSFLTKVQITAEHTESANYAEHTESANYSRTH